MRYNFFLQHYAHILSFNTPINANAIQLKGLSEEEQRGFNTPINANAIQLTVYANVKGYCFNITSCRVLSCFTIDSCNN